MPKESAPDYHQIAERIRGLIGGHNENDLSVTANLLGVPELSLRMSVDPAAPRPTLNVILAIIREHGVDPVWLLTGEYDLAVHRHVMEDGATVTGPALRDLTRGRITPTGMPVVDLLDDETPLQS